MIWLNAIVYAHVGSHARFACEALRAAGILALEGLLGQIGILHHFHRLLVSLQLFLLLPYSLVVLFLFHRRWRAPFP